MKSIITIIAIIICGFANAQTGYLVQPAKWKFIRPQWLDSGAWIKNISKYGGQQRVLVYDSVTNKIGYKYISSGATYSAGRGLTLNSNVFRLDTSLKLTWTANKTIFNSAPLATSQYGLVSLGSGAFDGSTSGFFTGSSSGTLLAGNLASGSTSDWINIQRGGSQYFKVNYEEGIYLNTSYNPFIRLYRNGSFCGALGVSNDYGFAPRIVTSYGYTSVLFINDYTLFKQSPTASANYGLVSLGNGAFDGSTSGFFTGSAYGTGLAMNMASGYAGDLMNLQVGGLSRVKVDNIGNETTKNGTTSGTLFTQTASGTVQNTTTETTLISTGVGSVTVPADWFEAGKSIVIHGEGIHSAQSNPNITVRIKIGGTTYLTTGAVQSGNSTDKYFEIKGTITCRTVGSSGTVQAQGLYSETGASNTQFGMVNTTTQTINTTTSNTIDITVEWDTAYSNNKIVLTNLIIEGK